MTPIEGKRKPDSAIEDSLVLAELVEELISEMVEEIKEDHLTLYGPDSEIIDLSQLVWFTEIDAENRFRQWHFLPVVERESFDSALSPDGCVYSLKDDIISFYSGTDKNDNVHPLSNRAKVEDFNLKLKPGDTVDLFEGDCRVGTLIYEGRITDLADLGKGALTAAESYFKDILERKPEEDNCIDDEEAIPSSPRIIVSKYRPDEFVP
jgi:hypothetical protein